MADHSDMQEQAKRTAKSRDLQKDAAHKRMLDSQRTFYESMASSEDFAALKINVSEPAPARAAVGNDEATADV